MEPSPMSADFDRVLDKLDHLDEKLDEMRQDMHTFRQATDSRLAAIEERASASRFEKIEAKLADAEKFQAMAKVYIGAAASLAGIVVGVVLRLLKVG